MIVLTYMIFHYTPLIVFGQRGVTVRYWVNWILRGGKEVLLKGVRTRLRFHVVVGVGMQLLAYAVLLMFWIGLYKDMRCSDSEDAYIFFFSPFDAYGVSHWVVVGVLGLYAFVLLYWLFDTVRNVYVSKKQAEWCNTMLQVLNGAKKETKDGPKGGPKGAFVGALMAVIDLGDARGQALNGARPTAAITERAVAVEELVDGAQFQAKVTSILLFVWVVTSALAVELLLTWNKIDDTSSIASYDQFFPFTVGLWVFLQSFFPPDESSIDSEQALRHVTMWCDAGHGKTSILETVRTGRLSDAPTGQAGGATNFLRYFV